MRPRLAGAALILVIHRDRQPRALVGGGAGLQRRDPRARRDDVRLDAPVLRRSAAREIRHRVLALAVDEKVEAVVLRRAGGDHVLRHGGAADGLPSRSGVAGAEFQDVRLIPRRAEIRVAHQRIELRRTDVVAPVRVVAPTVGADHRARAHGVARQGFKRRRRFIPPDPVEDALPDDVRHGRDPETVERARVVHLAGRAVARDDARDMRAVAVFIGGIGEPAVIKKGVHASAQVQVH